jgi:hypothetical protein
MDKKLIINVIIGALIALAIGAILNKLFFSSVVEKIGKKETFEASDYEAIEDEDEDE